MCISTRGAEVCSPITTILQFHTCRLASPFKYRDANKMWDKREKERTPCSPPFHATTRAHDIRFETPPNTDSIQTKSEPPLLLFFALMLRSCPYVFGRPAHSFISTSRSCASPFLPNSIALKSWLLFASPAPADSAFGKVGR